MREHIKSLISEALAAAVAARALALDDLPEVVIERTRDAAHGDFACPVALGLARASRARPRDIAAIIVAHLPASPLLARVEIAGPGFINLFLADAAYHALLVSIRTEGHGFGRGTVGAGRRVQVEFVSANPTGPLHVGHGRGAAYGSAVADLLEAAGYSVQREYYVNDAGRQMHILAVSVWLRYLQHCGEPVALPASAYRGEYIREVAASLHVTHGETLRLAAPTVLADLPADEPDGGDKELFIDALIERSRQLLGEDRYASVHDLAVETILDDIRVDLEAFGVIYQRWFSERSLVDDGSVAAAVARLREAGHVYEKDGALWFASSAFGDEKDRVVVRENGQATYFASDIAYHLDKFARGFERIINVWGADHHGYIARVKGSLTAAGEDASRLEVQLVQFANLFRAGQKVQMSTRSGEFVTLRELREEVGRDAARFFYTMRKSDQHLDFDLDLARSQSRDNPVYYVQYAHARVCSMLRRAAEQGIALPPADVALARLVEAEERELMATLSRYPEVVESAALEAAPHLLAHYLRDAATALHQWYDARRALVEDTALRDARMALADAARIVIASGLGLLGVSAPETM